MSRAALILLCGCSLYFQDEAENSPPSSPEPKPACRAMDPQVHHAEYSACWFIYEGPYLYGGATPLHCERGADPGHAFRTWTKVNPAGESWQVICGCPDDDGGCPDEKIGPLSYP